MTLYTINCKQYNILASDYFTQHNLKPMISKGYLDLRNLRNIFVKQSLRRFLLPNIFPGEHKHFHW